MEINKRCISAFAEKEPFVALATKSKLFDPSFSLTSELILVNYISGKTYPALTTDLKFCKIRWCEFDKYSYLVAGHENGIISIYDKTEDGLVLLKSKQCLEDDVTALDFLPSKGVLVAGSSRGKIIFWTLSNLDKEYALDIPISGNISSIAWNPKVSKILCVGTVDGNIKVLDIKKNSVIMTLNSREFSEIKHIEWDTENNTKLNVMSEKGYVTVFDLSNDSVSKFGNHETQLIGFSRNLIISKTKIEVNGAFIGIGDSFDCAVSKRDPVIALSHASGSTNIVSVPVVKNHVPFCRFSRFVVTCADIFEIKFVNNCDVAENNPFYSSLINILNTNENIDELAQFLFDNSSEIPNDLLDLDASVEVNIDDPIDIDFIKGKIDRLSECKNSTNLGLMNCLFTKDISALDNIKDFKLLYVFSRLLNNFSLMSKISNPRILAAFLIYHKNQASIDLLNKSKEGRIIRSIITKDFGQYIDERIPSKMPYLSRMKFLEVLIKDIKTYTKESLKSRKLSEYFWYQVFMSGIDAVKDLKISDPDIQYYLKAHKSPDSVPKIQSTANFSQRGSFDISEKMRAMDVKSADASMPRMNSFQNASTTQLNSQIPSMQQKVMPQFQSNNIHKPPSPRLQSQIQFPSVNSNASVYNHPPLTVPQFPTHMNNNTNGTFINPAMSASQPQLINQSNQGYNASRTVSSAEISRPSMPASIQNSFPVPPKSPFSGSIPIQNSFPVPPKSPFNGSIPQRQPGSYNPLGSANIPQRPSGMPQINPVTPSRATPQFQTASSSSNSSIENSTEIISKFDGLVSEVKQKAAMNNSLILRQRKMQCLNALSAYDSVDKNMIPSNTLHAMDLISKRFYSAGENMKNDLSLLVEGFNDILWLKAVVELIKMVY